MRWLVKGRARARQCVAMDLHDLVGYGVCHREAARTLDGAWLCLRCTGLYAGGLSGLALALRMNRTLGIGLQIALCLALIVPMGVDGLLLGRGSVMDVPWFRVLTGALAGVGSGLFLGARGLPHVQSPPGVAVLARLDWVWALGWPAAASIALWLGRPLPMDLLVAGGLAALCFAGSAWALRVLRWLVGRVSRSTPATAPFSLGPLALLVICELALVSVTPSSFKPAGSWFHTAVAWLTGLL